MDEAPMWFCPLREGRRRMVAPRMTMLPATPGTCRPPALLAPGAMETTLRTAP
jgi:hypothetical protein